MSIEKASRQKAEADFEMEDTWKCTPEPTDWVWESLDEDNDSSGGEPKRRKLENDPLSFSVPEYGGSASASASASGVDCSSTIESENEDLKLNEQEKICAKYFNLKLRHRKNDFLEIIQPDFSLSPKDIPNDVNDIRKLSQDPNFIEDGLPEDDAYESLIDVFSFKAAFCELKALYKAVKCLYENCVTCADSLEEMAKKVDLNSPPFTDLEDFDFDDVVKIHRSFLFCSECLFHPLIRKNFKSDFFSFVDIEAKLKERYFVKSEWPKEPSCPVRQRVFRELSQTVGLRDEDYLYCCEQIVLHRKYEDHLIKCVDNIKPDSRVEDLISDEGIVPKEFDKLNRRLIKLSLEACVKLLGRFAQCNQCFTNLEKLEEAHRENKTGELDELLIQFYNNFPCILDFSGRKQVDSAVEEGFMNIIHKMKESWFPGIADYYVIEATLLYMKNISSKDACEPSWPSVYKNARLFRMNWLSSRAAAYEDYIYDHVFEVDFYLA